MVNIFSDPDTSEFNLTNNTTQWFRLTDSAMLPPAATAGTRTLAQIGADFCTFKQYYTQNAILRSWFDLGYISYTVETTPGGVACPLGENTPTIPAGTLPPSSPQAGASWIRTPDNTLFIWDTSRSKWLSPYAKSYSVGRGFANAKEVALFGVDGTPTNQTPILIGANETLVAMTLESESTGLWTAQLRDFTTNIAIPGASATLSGSQSSSVNNLNIDLNTGDEIQIYLSAASGVSYPRVTIYTKERG